MTYAVRRGLVFGFLHVAKWVRLGLLALPHAERLLRPGLEPLLWRLGEWRLWLAVEGARKRVPAYQRFLAESGEPRVTLKGFRPDFSALPVTDKDSYVRRFAIEERCRDGRLPMRGAVIDESSGTSGEPNNWVRGTEERADGRKLLHMGLRQAFGDEPLFALNAFALGPWATGMAVSMAVVDVAVLKSVGPDIGKIEKTLRLFGPRYRYLLMGYPPFLKRLVDEADVDWSEYRVAAVVGGEGMSEALRSYLLRSFDRVYSSFGASDLEINLAGENDFTIAVRRLLAERPELGPALGLQERGGLPMVFQYNPLDYFVESTAEGELVVSICRVGTVAPKLRYNLHDIGAVVRFPVLRRALADLGLKPEDLAERPLDLPLLFHWGRADSTVAFYGANIGPSDLEEVAYSLPELAGLVDSFALVPWEDEAANKRLRIIFELGEGAESPDGESIGPAVLDRLRAVNQDYREAARFIPSGAEPTVEFHPRGTGPFAGHDVRLKRRYVVEG